MLTNNCSVLACKSCPLDTCTKNISMLRKPDTLTCIVYALVECNIWNWQVYTKHHSIRRFKMLWIWELQQMHSETYFNLFTYSLKVLRLNFLVKKQDWSFDIWVKTNYFIDAKKFFEAYSMFSYVSNACIIFMKLSYQKPTSYLQTWGKLGYHLVFDWLSINFIYFVINQFIFV